MKRSSLILLVLISTALFSFQADKWYAFSSSDGHFSMKFPTPPTENKSGPKPKNANYTVHVINCTGKNSELYSVAWLNMKGLVPPDKPIKQILEENRDAACKGVQATPKTLKIDLGKYPYIEYTFSNANLAGKSRIYLINMVQYNVACMAPAGAGLPANCDQFINSFQYKQ